MIRVLQYHEGEMDSPRAALKRHHGIICTVLRPERPAASSPTSLTTGGVTLYRYTRKSNGEPAWLVELRLFTPPDAEWTRTWVLDNEPTDAQIETLLTTDAQAGSLL